MTKRALNRWVCFHPSLEVSALWLWMANYHRTNGSRLSLLLVTWLYSSDMFFSLFLTRDDNGASVSTIFHSVSPEVKNWPRGHKSFQLRGVPSTVTTSSCGLKVQILPAESSNYLKTEFKQSGSFKNTWVWKEKFSDEFWGLHIYLCLFKYTVCNICH